MVPVPKDLKLLRPDRGHGGDDHDNEDHQHDVAGESWSRDKHQVPKVVLDGVGLGQFVKVEVMGDGVDQGEEDDGPGDGLVEGDGLVKGHDSVQGCGAQPGDEGAADRQEDDARVDMEDQGGTTGGWQGDTEDRAGILKVVRVKVVEEGESKEADVHQDPETEEDGTVSCVLL